MRWQRPRAPASSHPYRNPTRHRHITCRHTKSQRIGGDVALALPDADTATVWLDMCRAERALYEARAPTVTPPPPTCALCQLDGGANAQVAMRNDRTRANTVTGGGQTFAIENATR